MTQGNPYAAALYKVAISNCKTEEWLKILESLEYVIGKQEVSSLICDPLFTEKQLFNLLVDCLAISDLRLRNFVETLVLNRRLKDVPEIVASYKLMYKTDKKIAYAIIETAFPMDDLQKQDIEKKLFNRFGKTIYSEIKINQELIGGVKIIIDDTVIDMSVKGSLSRMAKELMK